jgi:hypothetical protein
MMCRQIPAEFLLANRFYSFPQERITYTSLRELRSAIESVIDELIYVDISVASVLSAVEQYPKMFRWDGEAVTRVEKSDSFFSVEYINSHFNFEVEESMRKAVLEAVCKNKCACFGGSAAL